MSQTVEAPKLLLGFDYGTKQIGVAVGQMITRQARELCNLKAQDGIPRWEQIEALAKHGRHTQRHVRACRKVCSAPQWPL